MKTGTAEFECYFRGEKLYGDDFTLEQIEPWFREEQQGFFDLYGRDMGYVQYPYHALDWLHGFSQLPQKLYRHILGIGSAYGEEFRPIASRVNRITILEPAEGFIVSAISGTPVTYVKPGADARMPFLDHSFDLITCLSVLHHIPNVSAVLSEVFRCLEPGGFALIREPVVSMGDWRRPRKGLTKNERGIPLPLFRSIICRIGFQICRERQCGFPVLTRLNYVRKNHVYNSNFWTVADATICMLPIWRQRYHPTKWFHKLRPAAVFFVLQRPECKVGAVSLGPDNS